VLPPLPSPAATALPRGASNGSCREGLVQVLASRGLVAGVVRWVLGSRPGPANRLGAKAPTGTSAIDIGRGRAISAGACLIGQELAMAAMRKGHVTLP
jgi:hypothetical protein